jgi:hypothetical protein
MEMLFCSQKTSRNDQTTPTDDSKKQTTMVDPSSHHLPRWGLLPSSASSCVVAFLLVTFGWSASLTATATATAADERPAVAEDVDGESPDDDPCLLYLAQSTIPNGG